MVDRPPACAAKARHRRRWLSELESGRELDAPRVRHGTIPFTEVRTGKVRVERGNAVVRGSIRAEVVPVPHVERLDSNLHVRIARQLRILDQCEVLVTIR